MHIEQHAARRDRDCKTDGEAGERGPRRSSALAADQERHTGVERSGRRGMATRKGRTQRRGSGIECRPYAIREILHGEGEDLFAAHDGDDERNNQALRSMIVKPTARTMDRAITT